MLPAVHVPLLQHPAHVLGPHAAAPPPAPALPPPPAVPKPPPVPLPPPVPAFRHRPTEHVCVPPQSSQASPSVPHDAVDVPAAHCPSGRQQPLQVAKLQGGVVEPQLSVIKVNPHDSSASNLSGGMNPSLET